VFPFSRSRHDAHVEDDHETIVGVAFDDPYRADELLTAVRRLAAHRKLVLKDAVLVRTHDNGRTEVRETIDPMPGRAAFSGAVWVSLLGLLVAGPVGWLAGAAVGAGTGAAVAKRIDLGLPDEWVDWFRDAARPGTATVALLVTDVDRNALVAEIERFRGGRLVYANLDRHTQERLVQALGPVLHPSLPDPPTDPPAPVDASDPSDPTGTAGPAGGHRAGTEEVAA
jgi:uncharacterized membrane protein